ncbi:MAG: DMT family transporter [Anaerolineae bacterium]|nr:DMT family transporter [Anaerolineae bacterium]
MHTNQTNLTRGYLIALASTAVLSTTAIFIRHLTQAYHLPALVLAFWRDVFVVLTLLPVLGFLRPAAFRVRHQDMAYLIGYGIVLAVFNALWALSVALNGAAIATVLVCSSAAFTALLGWWLLREPLGWVKLLAVALSLGGCLLVSDALELSVWRTNMLSILVGITTGLLYAVYSLMGRSASQRGLNPWTTLFYTFTFAAVLLLFVNLLPGNMLPGAAARPVDLFWLGGALDGWGILFLLAAGPTVVGFGLYSVSLGLLPSSVANLIATLEPAFTVVSAYFLLGESLNETQITGSLMLLASVAFLRIYEGWSGGRIEAKRTRAIEPLPEGLGK